MAIDPARVKALFQSAIERTDPADRRAFLEAEAGGDTELLGRLEALLAAFDGPSGVLDRPLAGELSATVDAEPGPVVAGEATVSQPGPSPIVGSIIAGRYKIRQEIGEGGMGSVYLAEQIKPVKRQVALKLIKPGMDSRQVLARFESERQALALMDHPHIARVLDAGTTEEGRPFFVMELVKGVPLTDYCDRHQLDLPARLALFRQICSAVQHAHQKGIIHRDLKPTNILVESHDGRPVPKVIDFGLAKATSGMQLSEHSLFTAFGSVTGTPLYMAPEQATFNALDVDTRADIYALGVILYELLTGSTPIHRDTIKRAALDEMLRVIREDEPPTPSSRISTSASLPSVAAARHVEPVRLSRLVRGDLDWIVMKALAKERDRRYDSAIGLANDVERFLNDEPVLAGPPTARYRTAKFIRRHRGRVVAAALVALALVGGTIGTTLGFFEARRQAILATERAEGERRAKLDAQEKKTLAEANEKKAVAAAEGERRAKLDAQEKKALAEANEKKAVAAVEEEMKAKETAEAVLGFVENKIFAAARPPGYGGSLGHDVKLVDAITSALPAIEQGFAGKPLIEARLRTTIGQSLNSLGKMDLAEKQYATALSLRTKVLGPDHADTLKSMNTLAWNYYFLRRLAEASGLHEEVLARRKAKLGPDHPDTLGTMIDLTFSYEDAGRHAEALKLREELVAKAKAKLGPDHPDTLSNISFLCFSYEAAGRHAEAIKLREELVALREARLGPDHSATLMAKVNLAFSYDATGRHAEASKLREALRKAKPDPDKPQTLWIMGKLAESYRNVGRHAEALKVREEALVLAKVRLGPDHPATLTYMAGLADSYSDVGRRPEASKLREETLAKLTPDDPTMFNTMAILAESYRKDGQHAQALKLREEVLARCRAKLGPDNPETLRSMTDMAGAYADTGAVDEAIALDRECLDTHRRLNQPNSSEMATAQSSAGLRLLRRERWAEAEPMLRESLATRQAKNPDDWKTFDTQSLLGGALLGQGKRDEARPLLIAGFEGMKQRLATIPAPDRGEPVAAADRLIRLAEATNNPDEANRWREEKARVEAQLKPMAPVATPPGGGKP